ncbi:MAG: hypothetical protein M1524_02185 [Patescibacteria group bacterium]|nr:hypothetical protein [Patescibacteria group bacterium]
MVSNHYLKIDIWSLRSAFSWVLLILALLLIPISVIFFWLRFSIFNTDQFVKTLSPISKNAYIVESLSKNVSKNFFENIDAENRIREALPDKAKFLAPALTLELKSFITEESKIILTSDVFNNVWERILRTAHPRIIGIITGRGDISVNNQGEVVLDFSDAVNKLKNNLNQKGITIFNNVPVEPQVTLFKSEKLAYFRNILSLISILGIVLPAVLILLTIGAIFSSLKRLKFAFWVGFGIVASSAILFFLVQIGENYFVKMAGEIDAKAAAELYKILTLSLKKISIGISFLGLIIALASKFLPNNRFIKRYLTK